MVLRKVIVVLLVVGLLFSAGVGLLIWSLASNLPQMVSVEDYRPKLVSEVYDIRGQRIGEFSRERRIVLPFEKFPPKLVQAFVAAEDANFFQHKGINYMAILRAFLANLKAGQTVQGGSTITQQVAKSLMLTREKTYVRKIREVMLSQKMEANLTKEQILYLYLNQIYLGQSAYGVEAAAQSYFRKTVSELTVPEMAILAGMPQAPSRYSPIINPKMAKQRQRYVLRRMAEEKYITTEESKKYMEQPVFVYVREKFSEHAPYFVETIRQHLVQKLGEDVVWDDGLRIFTTLDLKKQVKAQSEVQSGLRAIDKRQGFRGAQKNLSGEEKISEFLKTVREELISKKSPLRVLNSDGTLADTIVTQGVDVKRAGKASVLPSYMSLGEIVEGVVVKIDDSLGLVHVRLADSQGLIDIDTMKWARKPNPQVQFGYEQINRPSQALKVGDVIEVKIVESEFQSERIQKKLKGIGRLSKEKNSVPILSLSFEKFVGLELEQKPLVEGALIAFDLKTNDIVSMVGGYDFEKSEFNRAIQAARQTGSSFKPIVYAAGLDKGYNPATMIIDAPIVYQDDKLAKYGESETSSENKIWKPGNYGAKFGGDILFKNAIVQSKNIPTIKILESVGVERTALYSKRLGIFSPLNLDFTLGLGSSSVTLYEMTKAYSVFANGGRRIHPRMLLRVKNPQGEILLENVSLDERFDNELRKLDGEFEGRRKQYLAEPRETDPPIYFEDPDQLISPQTAYLTTSLLMGAIRDPGATGAKARVIGRPVAGKTGTTSAYYDAWFIGYSPNYISGVWVGFDDERSLGVGETGGDAALPIWIEYMKMIHENVEEKEFPVPPKIVFASIDNESGRPASAQSKIVVRQAFLEGTEPTSQGSLDHPNSGHREDKDFFKEDLAE